MVPIIDDVYAINVRAIAELPRYIDNLNYSQDIIDNLKVYVNDLYAGNCVNHSEDIKNKFQEVRIKWFKSIGYDVDGENIITKPTTRDDAQEDNKL